MGAHSQCFGDGARHKVPLQRATWVVPVCLALHLCACDAARHRRSVDQGARHRTPSSVLQLPEVNITNFEQAVFECAQQVRWCERRTGRALSLHSTCVRASAVAHVPGNRFSHLIEPKKDTFAWSNNCSLNESPLTVIEIVDAGLLAPFEPCGCIVLVALEPPSIFLGYEAAIACWPRFVFLQHFSDASPCT